MRILTQIRIEKNRPTLRDTINEYMKKKDQKDIRARERIQKTVMKKFEISTFQHFEEVDPNFNRLLMHIHRVLKMTQAQTLAIDSIERKINGLSRKKL